MDFSGLDNEQLLVLIKACLEEATKRGVAMQRAAYAVYLDAQEVARIQAEATARALEQQAELERQRIVKEAEKAASAKVEQQQQQTEAERIAANWKKRKAIGVALEKWGVTEDWQINVWSRGADVRVYVDGGGDCSYAWKMCFYVTGNAYHPPNSLEIEEASKIDQSSPLSSKEGRQIFKAFLSEVNKRWKGLKLTNREAENFDGDPDEKHLQAYLKALKLEVG